MPKITKDLTPELKLFIKNSKDKQIFFLNKKEWVSEIAIVKGFNSETSARHFFNMLETRKYLIEDKNKKKHYLINMDAIK